MGFAKTSADQRRRIGPQTASQRSRRKIDRLLMYRGKVKVSKDGVKHGALASNVAPDSARILPNRKWFGNTRTISQTELDKLRDAHEKAESDPRKVLLKDRKLPIALLRSADEQERRAKLLEVESFDDTFGPQQRRKRPRIHAPDLEQLASAAARDVEAYDPENDVRDSERTWIAADPRFEKGQSQRIWAELMRVVDSSDVLIQVLDARDPMGTRSLALEKMLKRPEHRHRTLIYLINKVDLVPAWVAERYMRLLMKEHPTLVFHARRKMGYGKKEVMDLLRHFSALRKDRAQVCVGFIGYPNVGKSSIINCLRGKDVASTAPIPGETKTWEYHTLTKRIYLIDCPGIVPPTKAAAGEEVKWRSELVLRGAIRIELLSDPTDHIPMLLEQTNPQHLKTLYQISSWTDADDFLERLAFRWGRLLPQGAPDVVATAKKVLWDWIRGRIPHYVTPPDVYTEEQREAHRKQLKITRAASNASKSVLSKEVFDKFPELEPVRTNVSVKDDIDEEEKAEIEQEAEDAFWADVFNDDEVDDLPQQPEEFDVPMEPEDVIRDDTKRTKKGSKKKKTEERARKRVRVLQEKAPRLQTLRKGKQKTGVHYYDTTDTKNRRQ